MERCWLIGCCRMLDVGSIDRIGVGVPLDTRMILNALVLSPRVTAPCCKLREVSGWRVLNETTIVSWTTWMMWWLPCKSWCNWMCLFIAYYVLFKHLLFWFECYFLKMNTSTESAESVTETAESAESSFSTESSKSTEFSQNPLNPQNPQNPQIII